MAVTTAWSISGMHFASAETCFPTKYRFEKLSDHEEAHHHHAVGVRSPAATLFGSRFEQSFRQKNQTRLLRPFGHDVAYGCSPLAVRIHAREKNEPAESGDTQKNGQGVFVQKFQEPICMLRLRLPGGKRDAVKQRGRIAYADCFA